MRSLTLTALALSCCLAAVATAISREDAAAEGVAYFSSLCTKQQKVYKPLLQSIKDRDLSGAIRHYIAARPYYEQIETLANSFESIDADIDARPYAFAKGEDSASFRGFHKLERLLYRDQDVFGAMQPALVLNASINALCAALKEPARFSPRKSWDGILALAYEVPAKKISSEEETWSDLSLMIFRSNFRGIFSQYLPFTRVPNVTAASVAAVNATYANIVTRIDVIDPKNGFLGTASGDARPYSKVPVVQRAALLKLAYEFATGLARVRDEVFAGLPEPAPAAEAEEADTPVMDSAAYAAETNAGIAYFATLCAAQQRSAAVLQTAIQSGDMAKARAEYTRARPPYEQIETLAGDFEQEDTEIDARPYAFDGGETNAEFVGFHKVERALYRDNDLAVAAKAMPPLIDAIDRLCVKLRQPANFSADGQWKGMLALAYEVPAKKIASEEETWSDLSVMIFRENAKGIYSQFRPFASRLPSTVAIDVERKYESIRRYFTEEVDMQNTWDGIEFRMYSTVPTYLRKGISDRFYALARSLEAARGALKKPM